MQNSYAVDRALNYLHTYTKVGTYRRGAAVLNPLSTFGLASYKKTYQQQFSLFNVKLSQQQAASKAPVDPLLCFFCVFITCAVGIQRSRSLLQLTHHELNQGLGTIIIQLLNVTRLVGRIYLGLNVELIRRLVSPPPLFIYYFTHHFMMCFCLPTYTVLMCWLAKNNLLFTQIGSAQQLLCSKSQIV